MELSVFNIKGEDTGRKVTLNDAIFGIEPNDHAIYLDVKQYLANQRQGTHKSKERSEISGSTRKLIRQKGGGGARRGDINSPEFVTIAKNLKVADKKLLMVLPEKNNFVYLSARNLEKTNVITASELNTYKVLDAANLVLTESSVAVIEKLFNA